MSEPKKKEDARVVWLVVAFFSLFLFLSLAHRVFRVVPAGHSGVAWKLSGGTVLNEEYSEGLHLMLPWNELALYNTRLRSETLEFDAQTLGGLPVKTTVAIRYRPKPGKLALLHKEVGRDYLESYVTPELRAMVATEVAQLDHEALYAQRSLLSQALLKRIKSGEALKTPLSDGSAEALVEVPEIFVNQVNLPPDVEQVVKEKFAKVERLEAAEYDLKLADLKNELLEKEGSGMARFQKLLGPGIEHFLTWKSIQATQDVAESQNSKVVIMGNGQNAPVLLNGD
jgi:regulator of protease activity HflC (stomatin/prohibitin superfamily)